MRWFLSSLGVDNGPVTLLCDNQGAIASAKDPLYRGKAKHIGIKYHFIRDVIVDNEIVLEYVPTGRMLADPMTRALKRDVFLGHIRETGLGKW